MENKGETAPQNKEVAAHQKLEFEPTPESTQIIKKYLSLNKKEVIVLQFYFHNFQYNTIQITT